MLGNSPRENTPITLANFLLGPNAILPTGDLLRPIPVYRYMIFLKLPQLAM